VVGCGVVVAAASAAACLLHLANGVLNNTTAAILGRRLYITPFYLHIFFTILYSAEFPVVRS
jgi:hypothetical protein